VSASSTRKASARRSSERPALTEGRTLKLADHSLLIAKDGSERSISDSAALIRNDKGRLRSLVFSRHHRTRRTERVGKITVLR
jgi:hypothetical protein